MPNRPSVTGQSPQNTGDRATNLHNQERRFMATRRSEFAVPVAEFAAALLARPEVGPRCQVMAEQVAQLLPGTAVVVYIIEDQDRPSWAPQSYLRARSLWPGAWNSKAGTLGTVAESRNITEC